MSSIKILYEVIIIPVDCVQYPTNHYFTHLIYVFCFSYETFVTVKQQSAVQNFKMLNFSNYLISVTNTFHYFYSFSYPYFRNYPLQVAKFILLMDPECSNQREIDLTLKPSLKFRAVKDYYLYIFFNCRFLLCKIFSLNSYRKGDFSQCLSQEDYFSILQNNLFVNQDWIFLYFCFETNLNTCLTYYFKKVSFSKHCYQSSPLSYCFQVSLLAIS